MTQEILLIAGDVHDAARARRRRLLEHAASLVPNAVEWSVHENEHASLALVTTEPGGGSVVHVDPDSTHGGQLVVLGVSEQAVHTLRREFGAGHRRGAEAGHVAVLLGRDGRVEIETDGIGYVPSFWSHTGDELMFATHLASLVSLGAGTSPDSTGVLEYLVMLHPLHDRTVLDDVELLPAGGRLVSKAGVTPHVEVRRLYAPSNERMTDDDAIHTFADVWSVIHRDMVARIDGRRFALGLSGGLDSRAIAAECERQGVRPFTFTYGSLATVEGRVAAAVAQALELDHAIVPVTEDRLLAGARESIAMLDGAHSAAETYEGWFTDLLRSFTDVLVNGLAGGPLWGDDKAVGIVGPDRVLAAQMSKHRGELDRLRALLVPDLAATAESSLRRGLRDSMREWDTAPRSDMVVFWRMHNRQFRWGNSLTNLVRRSGLRAEVPFLDSRFLEFSARLTPEQRLNGKLHLRAHREIFARSAGVPRGNDGNAPTHLSHVYWSGDRSYGRQLVQLATHHPVSAGRRAFRQVERMAADRMTDRPAAGTIANRSVARQSVFPADLWVRTSTIYRERLLDLLESSPLLPIFSPDAIQRVSDDIRAGRPQDGVLLIAKVATLQAWFGDYARRERSRASLT